MRRLADRLCDAMPAEHTSFLRSLKNSYSMTNIFCVTLACGKAFRLNGNARRICYEFVTSF